MPITIKGKNISNKIKGIIEELDGINKEVAQVAEKGLMTARRTLASKVNNNDFTQKYGEALIMEIGLVEKSPNNYEIVAPMSGNPEIAYQMYFAEYGAGVGANGIDGKTSQRTLRATSGYTPTKVDENGYWTYYDLQGHHHTVNTSIAVGYMETARKEMTIEMKNLSKRLKTKIHTRIKRN